MHDHFKMKNTKIILHFMPNKLNSVFIWSYIIPYSEVVQQIYKPPINIMVR